MNGASDPSIEQAIQQLAPHGVEIGHRLIMPGDEFALLPEEGESVGPVIENRRASGAARMVAGPLLAQLGHAASALPKHPSGAPKWPDGIVGSLAHDARVAGRGRRDAQRLCSARHRRRACRRSGA